MGCAHKSCKSAPGRARMSQVASVRPLPHTPPAHLPEPLSVSEEPRWSAHPVFPTCGARGAPRAPYGGEGKAASLRQPARPVPAAGSGRGGAEDGGVVRAPKRRNIGWRRGNDSQQAGPRAGSWSKRPRGRAKDGGVVVAPKRRGVRLQGWRPGTHRSWAKYPPRCWESPRL